MGLSWSVITARREKPALAASPALNRREILLLAPLAILVIYYGVQPQSILDAFAAPTEAVLRAAAPALESAATALAGAQ
jgi:NADH-quinone oxidoreductase subunit M